MSTCLRAYTFPALGKEGVKAPMFKNQSTLPREFTKLQATVQRGHLKRRERRRQEQEVFAKLKQA